MRHTCVGCRHTCAAQRHTCTGSTPGLATSHGLGVRNRSVQDASLRHRERWILAAILAGAHFATSTFLPGAAVGGLLGHAVASATLPLSGALGVSPETYRGALSVAGTVATVGAEARIHRPLLTVRARAFDDRTPRASSAPRFRPRSLSDSTTSTLRASRAGSPAPTPDTSGHARREADAFLVFQRQHVRSYVTVPLGRALVSAEAGVVIVASSRSRVDG